MPDGNLLNPWNILMKISQIVKVQIVTGIYLKTYTPGNFCSLYKRSYSTNGIHG